jgi:hypothetical protein
MVGIATKPLLPSPDESPTVRRTYVISSTKKTGRESKRGRRLELLTFPQGERFLWLGLDRSWSGRGNLGLTGGRKRGGWPGCGSRGNFVLNSLWRLKRLGKTSELRPRRVGSVGDGPCSVSVQGSLSDLEGKRALADTLLMFRFLMRSSLPTSAGPVGVASLERSRGVLMAFFPFLFFFINGVRSSNSSAALGEAFFPSNQRSPAPSKDRLDRMR